MPLPGGPTDDDVVDRIDALVRTQLAAGEPCGGHDFGDPTYPFCPHCDRHWHGQPVTERIAGMYALGQICPDYEAAADDSRVLCQGSDFTGPMPSEADAYSYPTPPQWLEQLISDTAGYVSAQIGMVLGAPLLHPSVVRQMIEQSNRGRSRRLPGGR